MPGRGIRAFGVTFVGAAMSIAALCAPSPARAEYSRFRHWFNDLGEAAWHFEAGCPKTEFEALPMCQPDGAETRLTPPKFSSLGMSVEQLQEWQWLREAIDQREDDLKANEAIWDGVLEQLKRGVVAERTPELASELRRMKDSLLMLGELEYEIEQLKIRPRKGGEQVVRRLEAAKELLLREHPFLAHEEFAAWVRNIKYMGVTAGALNAIGRYGEAPLKYNKASLRDVEPMLQAAFEKTLIEEALPDLLRLTRQRLKQYGRIRADESRLALAAGKPSSVRGAADGYRQFVVGNLNDRELIEELVIAADPARVVGLESLSSAGCRLRNRVLKDQAMVTVREYAASAVLLGAGWGVGRLVARGAAAIVSQGVVRGAAALRVGPWSVVNSVSLVRDLVKRGELEDRCGQIALAVASGVRHDVDGQDALESFAACHRKLSNHLLVSLVGNLGGMLTDARSMSILLSPRMAEKAILRASQ